MHLVGWAATSDAPWAALGVRVKVNGITITDWYDLANTYRPDVGAYLGPSYGNYHGFSIYAAVPAGISGGAGGATVCVEGQNNGNYNDLNQCIGYSMPRGAFFGGRLPHSPGGLVTAGYYNVSSPYGSQIASAASNYNTTYGAIYVPSTPMATSRFDLYHANSPFAGLAGSTLGVTQFTGCASTYVPPSVGCHNFYSEIYLFKYNMDAQPYNKQQATITHEMMHGLGLTHQGGGGTEPSIMADPAAGNRTDTLSAYDLTNISRLYPY